MHKRCYIQRDVSVQQLKVQYNTAKSATKYSNILTTRGNIQRVIFTASVQSRFRVTNTTRYLSSYLPYLYLSLRDDITTTSSCAIKDDSFMLMQCYTVLMQYRAIRKVSHLAEHACVISILMRRFKTEKIYDKQIEKETAVYVRRGKTNSMFSNSHNLKNSDLILSSI